MAKVTVIIPNYNHAEYLNRRIDSVLQQTYADFEIILLDDCSTDRSKEILLNYKNNPAVSQIVINEKNTGSPFEQWTKGFELSSGDYIWIAESDDWCEPTLLETLVNPMLADDSIVLSYCQSLLVTDKGEITYKTESNQLEQYLDGNDFVRGSMFGDTVLVNAGMAVFRKSSITKIDNLYKTMKSAGDWMFWVNIALTGNVFVSGKYLNYFNRHMGTVSSKSELDGEDIYEGNKVFSFVLKTTNPSDSEIQDAVKKRLEIYFQQKKKYSNRVIANNALKMVLELHPYAIKTYRKKIIRKLIFSLAQRIHIL
jgi:glycosyltransferase involved in cell wall biosynthesis